MGMSKPLFPFNDEFREVLLLRSTAHHPVVISNEGGARTDFSSVETRICYVIQSGKQRTKRGSSPRPGAESALEIALQQKRSSVLAQKFAK
jgi:hypothetical protein